MGSQHSTLAWITPVQGNNPGQPPVVGGGPITPEPPVGTWPGSPGGGGPVDPGFGIPGSVDPGWGQGHPMPPHGPIGGGSPTDPGWSGGVVAPPHVGGGPSHPVPPHLGGGPIPPTRPVDPGWGKPVLPIPPTHPPAVTAGKPGGVPILPMDPSWTPPTAAPAPPGTWVTLDAGKGQPPAWGFIPDHAPDHGLGGPIVSPAAGQPQYGQPAQFGGAQPPQPGGGQPTGGHWVPVGTAQPKGGAPAPGPTPPTSEPTWAFVPEIGASYGVKQPTAGPK